MLTKAWARWREADFTWDGLAKKPWRGWVVNRHGFLVEGDTGRRYGADDDDPIFTTQGQAATLQDHWRADPTTGRRRNDEAVAADLIQFPGQPTYHIAHLPLTYADGTETAKVALPDNGLDDLVQARLRVAAGPDGAADRRSQFQGGVWLRAASHPQDIESLPSPRGSWRGLRRSPDRNAATEDS